MEDVEKGPPESPERRRRSWARPAAFGLAGLLAGGLLAGSLSAAADNSGSGGDSGAAAATATGGDQSRPQRPDENLLTGTKESKVRAAALAKYPGATVVRIETDSDGVYEAHLVTAAGQPVTVEVGEDFQVTGTEAAGGPGGMPGWPSDGTGSASGSST